MTAAQRSKRAKAKGRRVAYVTKKRRSPAGLAVRADYKAFQAAYDFFNKGLFGGALPFVLITLQRHAKSYGYFAPERFTGRSKVREMAHELALNPDGFTGRTDEEILSTLVHEMCHVWQHACGNPRRRAYHDRQWADRMKQAGLQPTATGLPGARETGQNMTHYIVPGGAFTVAYAKLRATGLRLDWQSAAAPRGEAKKRNSKTKYTCPGCGLNAWAKPDAALVCGDCHEDMDAKQGGKS